jgi:protein-S-isoprenylcysteine O-methyltransferase Ste14
MTKNPSYIGGFLYFANKPDKTIHMKSKKRLWVWIIMMVGGLIVSLIFDWFYFRDWLLSLRFHLISFVLGMILMSLVRRVARNTGRTLAKYGRQGDIERMETNVLVSQGPYGLMRHPMHLALLFFPLAWGMLFGSVTFILFVWPLEVIFMILMIKWVEEPEARAKFGKAYDEYAAKRPWFCVTIRCIKELFKEVPSNGNTKIRGCT